MTTAETTADAGRLTWSPQWTVSRIDGSTGVVLVAGTDRVLRLDGLDADAVEAVVAWSNGSPVVGDTEAVAHLLEIGVLVAAVGAARAPTCRLIAAPALRPVAAALGERSRFAVEAGGAVDVIVRNGPRDDTAIVDTARPRLIVDVGAEHTIVIGPYVVPGRSACEQCLARLHARRWPSLDLPERCAVTDEVDLLAALVDRHVELIVAGRSPVINATIAFDVDAMTSRRESLLMSPGCPTCAVPPSTGRVAAVLESR